MNLVHICYHRLFVAGTKSLGVVETAIKLYCTYRRLLGSCTKYSYRRHAMLYIHSIYKERLPYASSDTKYVSERK